jgi:hypothetical protein
MRSVGVLLACTLGCGRYAFFPCSDGKSGSNAPDGSSSIQRGQVVSPGSSMITDLPMTVDQTVGDLVLIGTYTGGEPVNVTDSLGETWQTLPAEVTCPTSNAMDLRFFYAEVAHTGTNTIGLHVPFVVTLGGFAIVYSGVGSPPVDTSAGQVAPGNSNVLSAGTVDTTGVDQVVALLGIPAPLTLIPGSGYTMVTSDDSFSAMIEEASLGPGSYNPTATMPAGMSDSCWAGSTVALRAR